MPNFWSKAGQFISEKISGSRTQDNDIATACEKMKNTEKGLLSLKFVLQSFLKIIFGIFFFFALKITLEVFIRKQRFYY